MNRRMLYIGAAGVVAIAFTAAAMSFIGAAALPARAAPAPSPSGTDAVTVIGAANGVLSITSTGPTLDATVTLRARQPPASVSVQVTPFIGPGGESFSPVVPAQPSFVGQLATVRITAPLPYGGPFRADLLVIHDGIEDEPVTLSVTRTRAPTPVTVEGITTSSAVSDGARRQTVHRLVTITETSGRATTLGPLAVVTASGSYAEQTVAADVGVSGLRTTDPTDVCTVDSAGHTITVQAGRACQLDITLELPASPGTYEFALRFAAPGFAPVDDKVTIQLRRSLPVAALVILGGVAVGMVIAVVLRPRLQRQTFQHKVAVVRDRLRAAQRLTAGTTPDAAETSQIEGLHGVLDAVHRRADTDVDDATARLDVAQKQIDLLDTWIALRQAIAAAEPPATPELMRDWDSVSASMIDSELSLEEAKKLPETLAAIGTQLDAAARAAATRQVEQLTGQLSDLGLDADSTAARLLAQAKETAEAAGPVSVTVKLLTQAQEAAADVVAERIRAVAETDLTQSPYPVDAAAWAQMRTDVTNLLRKARTAPAGDRLELLRSADRALISGVATAFEEYVRAERAKWSQGTQMEQANVSLFDPVQAALAGVNAALGRDDLGAARRAYAEAGTTWAEFKSERDRIFGVHLAGPQGSDPPAAPPAVLGQISVPPVVAGTPVRASSAELYRSQQRTERILLALAGLAAVLTGLATLYLGRPTWGGPVDLVTALLWGIGITTAGGLAGFASVHNTITR